MYHVHPNVCLTVYAAGLVMSPDNLLIVLETCYRRTELVHMTQDGVKKGSFLYSPLLEAQPGSNCRFMGIHENTLIVSDLG